MKMTDIKHIENEIDKVINATFEEIVKIYKLQNGEEYEKPQSKLRFPYKYDKGKQVDLRISEQELRFLLVEKLQCSDLYYNVEAPTKENYNFSGNEGNERSGNFDLVICDDKGEQRYALIEFKGLNPKLNCYQKDFEKLENKEEEGALRYFIQVVKSADDRTCQNIKEKKIGTSINITKYKCVCLTDGRDISDEIISNETNNS